MTQLILASKAWQTVWSVAVALLILLVMITVHEFGHYVAGKIFKFKIDEFAIGFGPKLYRKNRKNGEVFSVRALPLGGFCAFRGEDEDDDHPGAFHNKKPWQRIIVLISGAMMNFLLALVVIIINFGVFGQTMLMAYDVVKDVAVDPAYSLQSGDVILEANGKNVYLTTDLMDAVKGKQKGDKVTFTVLRKGEDGKNHRQTVEVVLRTDANIKNLESTESLYDAIGIAQRVTVTKSTGAGLQAGDVIYQIDGAEAYGVPSMIALLDGKTAGQSVTVTVWRDGAMQDVTVTLLDAGELTENAKVKAMLGIEEGTVSREIYGCSVKLGFFQTIGRAFQYAFRIAGTIFTVLGQLLTGKLGFLSLGGPVTTISMTSQMVAAGWRTLLEITAFIGVNLAVFNLLPIPALDGSRVVFTTIEWVRKKPLSRKIEAVVHFVGFVVLIGFALLVDLLQLF